jgi:hypothetical protein
LARRRCATDGRPGLGAIDHHINPEPPKAENDMRSTPRLLALSLFIPAACAPSEKTGKEESVTTTSSVAAAIIAPANGDSLNLPVVVQLGSAGIEIVPATGVREEGKAHHHLLVDMDAPSDTLPLPSSPTSIHLGTGADVHSIDSLAPGSHRIIAMLAWGDHIPVRGARRDTVTFTVRADSAPKR